MGYWSSEVQYSRSREEFRYEPKDFRLILVSIVEARGIDDRDRSAVQDEWTGNMYVLSTRF